MTKPTDDLPTAAITELNEIDAERLAYYTTFEQKMRDSKPGAERLQLLKEFADKIEIWIDRSRTVRSTLISPK